MNKILGVDLGTNSIGWAIRDISESDNQIIDKGVLTFEKGVGEGKSGEFPLVQKRTESRSKRRNYQAEKYRKWALLRALIAQQMCPLNLSQLDEWCKYTKGVPRKYPQGEQFLRWLRYDFDGDGKPDFERLGFDKHENHYLFRMLAASDETDHQAIFRDNPMILGRVLYHMVQRRGFRGRDEEEAKTIMQGSKDSGTIGVDAIIPYLQKYQTLGAALYHLHKEKGEKIRRRYNLRSDYEHELKIICRVQGITEPLYKQFWTAIIWQRPLRSQKGLVGICTFESNKPRCPVSHPFYEEFKTWNEINNLNIRFSKDRNREALITEKIYPLFYNASRDFKLKSVATTLRKMDGKITSRKGSDPDPEKEKYKLENTKLVSAGLLYQFESLLGQDWKEKYGWNEALQNLPKSCAYSIEDIWHVLFTFDDRVKLRSFAIEKLHLTEEVADKFAKLKLVQGYAPLSLSAIKKILPYLRKGFLYSHAVYLANLHKVLGEDQIGEDKVSAIALSLATIFQESVDEKLLTTAANLLISDQLNSDTRFGMDPIYQLDEDDKRDIICKLEAVFGERTWTEKSTQEKDKAYNFVAGQYLQFLKKPIQYTKEKLFLKSIPLHDKIFLHLQETYGIPDSRKKLLWHPSEQETYPPAKRINGIPQLGSPIPISRGFKNPMALKTLHKLRHLINDLLRTGKIDEDTRVVVEIARELNDTNRRKAIERWQRVREKENSDYRARIKEINEEYQLGLDIDNNKIIDKYRLWIEQKGQCIYTGEVISCKDLFDGTKYDLEHTIPASISFDNELKNLTIANSRYNREVKGNKFPTQLPNYREAKSDFPSISKAIGFIEEKVANLESQYEEWLIKAKFASTKEVKDACIQRKHLIRFELDYWRYKLHSFTLTEYKAGWRNSQLKDTQIVTKYALPYLRTVFQKVEVQKGSVVATFRNIYKISPANEIKNRDLHSHHAKDAAILTLIPPAAIRDKILLRYNQAKDMQSNAVIHEPVRNWKNFDPNYILGIEKDVLINYQAQQRALTPTYKNVRKRGRKQYVKEKAPDSRLIYKLDEKGNRIELKANGDSIRGQLHKESMFGIIEKNGEKWLVERYSITQFGSINDCRNIVDDAVRQIVQNELEKRMAAGESFEEAKYAPISFPNGKAEIKKVRCRVAAGRGYLTPEKALAISQRTSSSKHDYKQVVYAQNEENILCLYYEQELNGKLERGFRIVGLFELAQLRLKSFKQLNTERYYQTMEIGKGKSKRELQLAHIITSGMKAIVWEKEKEELKELSQQDLFRRVFKIYKFNDRNTIFVYMQNHLEARPNDELGYGDSEIDVTKYQPRISLSGANFKCALEGKDFSVKLDGTIEWKF
jgi:CRISPR-associated endonuclease Csn1